MTNNQQLKAHCRDVIANPQDHLDWVVDMARMALASLEAEPRSVATLSLTAEHQRIIEMLLNVCGAAFELADDSCQQEVDGDSCHVIPDSSFIRLSDALDEIENSLPTEDADRPDVFLSWSAMPRAALKSLLTAPPVAVMQPPKMPQRYTTRIGTYLVSGAEVTRVVMIPDEHGQWLSVYDVEHEFNRMQGIPS